MVRIAVPQYTIQYQHDLHTYYFRTVYVTSETSFPSTYWVNDPWGRHVINSNLGRAPEPRRAALGKGPLESQEHYITIVLKAFCSTNLTLPAGTAGKSNDSESQ